MRIVPLCLDSDPSLIPLSCKVVQPPLQISDTAPEPTDLETYNEHRDDDFSFWSERQAKRISAAIKQIFDVEYAPEVIVADANLMALAKRILVSKEILSFGPGGLIA
jgi:phosphatidylethanolamine N-methyltransferase